MAWVQQHVANNKITKAVVSMSLGGTRSASLNSAAQALTDVSLQRHLTYLTWMPLLNGHWMARCCIRLAVKTIKMMVMVTMTRTLHHNDRGNHITSLAIHKYLCVWSALYRLAL